MKPTRNRQHQTSLAIRARRLNLSLKDIERLTGEPYGSIKNWNQGKSRCPRSVLKLLSYYRLKHWGQF